MTKQERAKLASEMSRIIAGYLSRGERVTTSQIRDLVMDAYPEAVEEAGRQLIAASLSNMARNMLKKASKAEEADLQTSLFGNTGVSIQVPKCIAVPAGDDAREMTWTSIADATLSEISAYVQYLRKGAKADFQKANMLDTFRDKVVDLAGDDNTEIPIRELLHGFRAEKMA